MVRTSKLVVSANQSPYKIERENVYCYKKAQNDRIYIPCKYNTLPRKYQKINYPNPLVELKPDQEKVLQEYEELCKSQIQMAKDKLKAQKDLIHISSKTDNKTINEKDDVFSAHKYDDPNDIPFTLDSIAIKDDGVESCICHPVFGHIYTGFGKTYSTIVWAAQKKLPILVFINTDSVRQAWIKSFKDILGMDAYEASGKTLEKRDICVLSIQLAVLHQYSRDIYSHYGTVIVDEADTLCTQLAVNVLLDLSPKYFIGLTATVRRGDGLDKVMDIFWGHRKFWIKRIKEFGEECMMKLNILHTGQIVESVYNKRGNLDWNAMAEMVANIYERNILIRNLCLLHRDSKILILCKRKEHVEILVQLLTEVGENVSTYYGNDNFYYDAHILIATLSKAGRGYDDKQVSAAFDGRRFDVLIMTMTMKNADQAMGRGLRGDKLNLYLLVDDNSTMKNHADDMKKINSKRGAIINEEYI